ncbi:epimerase family protein SDR39U1 [Brevipalpus obovatus]|uniref:epimerase family protein SDR39U1 n=1 Tax=Brevipalpus obovatus TaxID=246614 RepID=UPI003D9DC562
MATKFSTVLVGGGTGFVGSFVVDAFRRISNKVLIVSRKPTKETLTWEDISKNGLPNETDVVINLAGQNVLDPFKFWTDSFKQTVIQSRVGTTKTLAEAINSASKPPQALITISGVGYYPPSETAVYDEESKPDSSDFFSKLCQDWEDASKLNDKCPTRRVIIRSGVVIGPGGGIMKQMYPLYWTQYAGPIGSGKQYFPWIHVEDLANMFVFAAKNNQVTGVLNGVAPQKTTNHQFSTAFGEACLKPAIGMIPEWAIRLIFGPVRAEMMTKGQLVVPKRAVGYGFKYLFEDIEYACKNSIYG